MLTELPEIKTITVKLRLPKTYPHLLCFFGRHAWVKILPHPTCAHCSKDIFTAMYSAKTTLWMNKP